MLLQGLIEFDVAELVNVMQSAALTADDVLVQMCRMDAVRDTAAGRVATSGGKVVANVMDGCYMRHSSWTSGCSRREGCCKCDGWVLYATQQLDKWLQQEGRLLHM